MRIASLVILFAIPISLFLLIGCSEVPARMTTKEALQIVKDSTSSSVDFDIAIKKLDSVKGDAKFWLTIAADNRCNPDRRRHCIKHFFCNFISVGEQLDEVTKQIGKDVNWISFDHIKKVNREAIGAGWIPDALTKGESSFTIPILSNEDGDYRLVIFLAFKENVRLDDLLNGLKNGKTTGNAKMTIAGFAAYDSDDYERRFPGSEKLNLWPWN